MERAVKEFEHDYPLCILPVQQCDKVFTNRTTSTMNEDENFQYHLYNLQSANGT